MHRYESLTRALQGRTDIQKNRKTFSALKCDFSVASSSRTAHPSLRCSSSPTSSRTAHPSLPRKRESSVASSLLLSHVVASSPSFAPGQGRELSHSVAPPLPRRRGLRILRFPASGKAQSLRRSSSPTKCRMHFAGSQNCTSWVPDAALRGFPKARLCRVYCAHARIGV